MRTKVCYLNKRILMFLGYSPEKGRPPGAGRGRLSSVHGEEGFDRWLARFHAICEVLVRKERAQATRGCCPQIPVAADA